MSLDTLVLKLELDSSGAKTGAKEVARELQDKLSKAAMAAAKALAPVETAVFGIAKATKKTIDVLGDLGLKLFGIREGFRMVKDMAGGLAAALSAPARALATLEKARALGLTERDAEALRATLGGAVSRAQALAKATNMVLDGIHKTDVGPLLQASAAVSAITDETQEQVQSAIRSGYLTERQLVAVGKTRIELQTALAKATADAGGTLDPQKRLRAMIKFLDITKETAAAMRTMGQQSPFAILIAEGKSLIQETSEALKPGVGIPHRHRFHPARHGGEVHPRCAHRDERDPHAALLWTAYHCCGDTGVCRTHREVCIAHPQGLAHDLLPGGGCLPHAAATGQADR